MEEKKEKKEAEKESSSIENLEKDLYSRDNPSVMGKDRFRLTKSKEKVSDKWKNKENTDNKVPEKAQKSSSLFKKIFISAVIFFILAVSVSLFIIFGGLNIISSQNVDITVRGLTVIEGGEELVLDVLVENKNRVSLEDVLITIEYPEGTRNHQNINDPLLRQQKKIENISAQGQFAETFRSVLFGEQNSVKEIRIIVEYKTEGSNAVFSKMESYEVGIRSSPLNLLVSVPEEISSGQEVGFNITFASNSNSIIKDVIIVADYPTGFVFDTADPMPIFENRVWRLGDLDPREEKEIILQGRLKGSENEEKTFKVSAGLPNPENKNEIGVEFVSSVNSIFIQKPFIDLTMSLEGTEGGDYVSKINDRIRGQVKWKNSLPVDLNDASLEVRLNGSPLDKLSITAGQGGFYNSIDNVVFWNKNNNKDFERILSGQGGSVNFSFNTLKAEPSMISQLRNGTVEIEAIMKGTRFLESRPPEQVSSSVSRMVKIESDLAVKPEIVYSVGPFENSGPIPPKAEQPTTYTVTWRVSNSFNDVEDALVTATLPVYVEWLENINPSSENINFNSSTRVVSWEVGNIDAGTGFFLPEREVSFQISFLPSLGQIGSSPTLVSQSSIIGTDTFTLTDITSKGSSLSTLMPSDPIYSEGNSRVEQ